MSILSHLITCYHILSTLSHVLLRIDILYIVFFASKFVPFLKVVSYHRNVDFVTSYHIFSTLPHVLLRIDFLYIVFFASKFVLFLNVSVITEMSILSHLITSYLPYHMFC